MSETNPRNASSRTHSNRVSMGQRCSRAKLMAISRTGFTERLSKWQIVGQPLLPGKSPPTSAAADLRLPPRLPGSRLFPMLRVGWERARKSSQLRPGPRRLRTGLRRWRELQFQSDRRLEEDLLSALCVPVCPDATPPHDHTLVPLQTANGN